MDEVPNIPLNEPEPHAVPWELSRTDSLNIAFVKGALIGFACGAVLNDLFSFAARELISHFYSSTPGGPITFTPGGLPAWYLTFSGIGAFFPPLGIVIGGFMGRARRKLPMGTSRNR